MKHAAHATTPEAVASSEHLSMMYGDQKILDLPEVVSIPRGFTAIIGRSGSGKSTYLNILAGFTKPTTGRISHYNEAGEEVFRNASNGSYVHAFLGFLGSRFLTQTPTEHRIANYRSKHTGYISQQAALYPNLSIGDYIRLSHEARGNKIDHDYENHLLETLGIADLLHKRPSQLSGGEEQRAAIVHALVHKPRIIFADEPTSALDPENSEKTLSLFAKAAELGSSVLMVSHDIAARDYADTVIAFERGHITDHIQGN